MARKKKTFNYQFIDCDKSFASSVVVVCTQTKEKVKMYHKQLVRLIEILKNNLKNELKVKVGTLSYRKNESMKCSKKIFNYPGWKPQNSLIKDLKKIFD